MDCKKMLKFFDNETVQSNKNIENVLCSAFLESQNKDLICIIGNNTMS